MKPDELAALAAQVQRTLAAEQGTRARLRSWARGPRLALVALTGLAIAALFATVLVRRDHASYPMPRLVALVAAYAAVALVAGWQALRPLWRAPASRRWLVVLYAVGLTVPLVAAFLPELPTLHGHRSSLAHHLGWTFECWLTGGVAGAALLVLTRVLDRGGHGLVDHALLAGLSASMLGLLALQLECPLNYPTHLLAAHATLPFLFLGLSFLLWRRR